MMQGQEEERLEKSGSDEHDTYSNYRQCGGGIVAVVRDSGYLMALESRLWRVLERLST